MGLFSKLVKQVIGDAAEGLASEKDDALKEAKEAFKEAQEAFKEAEKSGSLEQAASFLGALAGAAKLEAEKAEPEPAQTLQAAADALDEELTVPGNSWGPTMPLEENQYNFPGTPAAYFEKILAEDFPGYRLEKEVPQDSKATVFTLWEGDKQAAVVELLNKNSVRNKIRRDCRLAGIPYTRFYFDVEGWWNTRVYVKERIQKAMAGEI